jgi:hypothetical protein
MAFDAALADRIRDLLIDHPGVTERKMFGGLAFMVYGNMACGPNGEWLIVRVGPAAYDASLAEPEASEMTFTGRPMKGFVQIEVDALDEDAVLAKWVSRGVAFAESLPMK